MTGVVAMAVSRVGTAGAIRIRLIPELRHPHHLRTHLQHRHQHHLRLLRHPHHLHRLHNRSEMDTIQCVAD
jgi:hypothetical protein